MGDFMGEGGKQKNTTLMRAAGDTKNEATKIGLLRGALPV